MYIVRIYIAYKDKRADSLIPEEYLSQRPKKGVDEDDAGGPMAPPTSPPHDTFSATEGEGEAVFAGKPISRGSPRKLSLRNEEMHDEKTHPKRQKISSEKLSGQSVPPLAGESKAAGTTNLQRGSPQSRSKPDQAKDEKQSIAPPQPPPPPPRRQSSAAPPPPPPKGPPTRKLPNMKPPPPPPPSVASNSKPPPPPNQGTSGSPKPPPPVKAPAPPSKPVHHAKRPPVVQDVSLDLQTPDVKPNVNLPPGWMCVWSKSQKRWYFFNTKNNKSVWQWPPP